jgi:hypothetical protein
VSNAKVIAMHAKPPGRGQDEPAGSLEWKIVCLDFDGVLNSFSDGWTTPGDIGDPEPGAVEFVSEMMDEGAEVVIQSRRASTREGRAAMRTWLMRHGFPWMHIFHEKPTAHFYVDDRAVRYVDDFRATLQQMRGGGLRLNYHLGEE